MLLDRKSYFQELIVTVLYKVLVPEINQIDFNFTNLMKRIVSCITNLHKITSWTSKVHFCWGILNSICSKIKIDNSNLTWVKNYSEQLIQCDLAGIYRHYELNDLPEVIHQHHSGLPSW